MIKTTHRLATFLVLLLVVVSLKPVLAYGGPGSVISGIGALLAAVAALLASLFGFIWFPLKRLYRKMTDNEAESSSAGSGSTEETSRSA